MTVKALRIDPRLDPSLLAVVREAGPEVERVLGDAADRVEVTWEPGPADAAGRPTVRFGITDSGVGRNRVFAGDEFDGGGYFRHKVRQVWLDVLGERTRLQRQKVYESLAEEGGY
jgi:hypothetical protein